MLIEIYTVGRRVASFDPMPGGHRRFLVAPGGSELLETRVDGESSTVLFVPTKDPCQRSGWTAKKVLEAARRGGSRFHIMRSRVPTVVRRGREVDEQGSVMSF